MKTPRTSAAPIAIQTTSRVPTSQAVFSRVKIVHREGDQQADDHEDETKNERGLIHREIERTDGLCAQGKHDHGKDHEYRRPSAIRTFVSLLSISVLLFSLDVRQRLSPHEICRSAAAASVQGQKR